MKRKKKPLKKKQATRPTLDESNFKIIQEILEGITSSLETLQEALDDQGDRVHRLEFHTYEREGDENTTAAVWRTRPANRKMKKIDPNQVHHVYANDFSASNEVFFVCPSKEQAEDLADILNETSHPVIRIGEDDQ